MVIMVAVLEQKLEKNKRKADIDRHKIDYGSGSCSVKDGKLLSASEEKGDVFVLGTMIQMRWR